MSRQWLLSFFFRVRRLPQPTETVPNRPTRGRLVSYLLSPEPGLQLHGALPEPSPCKVQPLGFSWHEKQERYAWWLGGKNSNEGSQDPRVCPETRFSNLAEKELKRAVKDSCWVRRTDKSADALHAADSLTATIVGRLFLRHHL